MQEDESFELDRILSSGEVEAHQQGLWSAIYTSGMIFLVAKSQKMPLKTCLVSSVLVGPKL
jgi:hypothetical protein